VSTFTFSWISSTETQITKYGCQMNFHSQSTEASTDFIINKEQDLQGRFYHDLASLLLVYHIRRNDGSFE